MTIALVMMKMFLISMSIFVECIELASTHQIGKIDFARGISIWKTKWLQERLDDSAERFNIYRHPCELCNEHGHLKLQCYLFHDQIMSKNYDKLITLEDHKELSLLLGYEEMKRITEGIPKYNLDRFLDFDLEEIFMYCAVNCIENPYIANYIKTRKQIEDKENTN